MCQKSSIKPCVHKQFADYELKVKPEFSKIIKKATPRGEKISASEFIGTMAAIAVNAVIHNMTFSQSTLRHVEFQGCGVFDLIMDTGGGAMEVKEAKGGSSRYGTRMQAGGKKRVKQCTPSYNREIIEAMRKSNYKGRHPTVPCAAHAGGGPHNDCPGCVSAERNHRRSAGTKLLKSLTQGKLTKVSVRGGYNKTCLKNPAIIESYKTDGKGKAQPMSVVI
jgi:hypothetical protein